MSPISFQFLAVLPNSPQNPDLIQPPSTLFPLHVQSAQHKTRVLMVASPRSIVVEPWLISNLMHKILIYLHIIHLLKFSTCFEHYTAHLQEVYIVIVYMQPLVSLYYDARSTNHQAEYVTSDHTHISTYKLFHKHRTFPSLKILYLSRQVVWE